MDTVNVADDEQFKNDKAEVMNVKSSNGEAIKDSVSDNSTQKSSDSTVDDDSASRKKKSVTIGDVTHIQASDICNFGRKTNARSVNADFLRLSAGAKKLLPLPKRGPKSILQRKAMENVDISDDKSETSGDKSSTSKNTSEIEVIDDESADKIPQKDDNSTVGEVKSITQVTMANISQSFNKSKSTTSIDKNFLLLRAGANALLPSKGPKKKSAPKVTSTESKEKDRPRSPGDKDSDYSNDSDRRYSRSSRTQSLDYDDEYYCKVCDVPLNSEATWVSHIEGKKHQKKLALSEPPRRSRQNDDLQYMKMQEGCRINRVEKTSGTPHIQSTIESLDEPVVGLSYVSEIWRLDRSLEDTYFCSLCCTTCQLNTIISHIIGYKHRFAYMKMCDPFSYETIKHMSSKKSELTALLQTHAANYEKTNGPGRIKIEIEVGGYVAPLETGQVFNSRQSESPPPFPLLAEGHSFDSPVVKLKCLEEAGANIDVSEIVSRQQINSINRSIENLKASLSRYVIKDPMLQRRIFRFLQSDDQQKMGLPPPPPPISVPVQYPVQPQGLFPRPSETSSGFWAPATPSPFRLGRQTDMGFSGQYPPFSRGGAKRRFSSRDE